MPTAGRLGFQPMPSRPAPTGVSVTTPSEVSVNTVTVIAPVRLSSEACFWNQRTVCSWRPTHIAGLVDRPPAGMESERLSDAERTLYGSFPLTILAPPLRV